MRPALVSQLVLFCLPAAARAAAYAGKPTRLDGLTLSAAVRGDRVAFATGHGFAGRFWPGVNRGATVPGTQPGELAATRADYDRWLRGIGALGARVVRVYTILRPAFYDALAAYDRRHPRTPLRFIQGVWVPEERWLAIGDAYDPRGHVRLRVRDGRRRRGRPRPRGSTTWRRWTRRAAGAGRSRSPTG